jgi:uncharacterized protein
MTEAAVAQPEDQAPPLDAETEAFVATCERLSGFADINTDAVDGFLTLVAALPRMVLIDEWLTPLFGDNFERCFADPADAAPARDALQRRLLRHRVCLEPQRLADAPEQIHLEPYVSLWSDADRAAVKADGASDEELPFLITGADWAWGFIEGLEQLGGEWVMPNSLLETAEKLLQQVQALGLPEDEPAFAGHLRRFWRSHKPTRMQLLDAALLAVQDLSLLWLEQSLKPEQRVVEPKAGRNDPCPCGSGKKFKKCHGAS